MNKEGSGIIGSILIFLLVIGGLLWWCVEMGMRAHEQVNTITNLFAGWGMLASLFLLCISEPARNGKMKGRTYANIVIAVVLFSWVVFGISSCFAPDFHSHHYNYSDAY